MPESSFEKLQLLTHADITSIANALCGSLAIMTVTTSPTLAARLILLAAIADGLDGILARKYGSSDIGIYLDSLSDTISFTLAPAILVTALSPAPAIPTLTAPLSILTFTVSASFIAAGLIRLGYYTADHSNREYTLGVPTTLAATIITTLTLTNNTIPIGILATTVLFTVLMLGTTRYPDLYVRDALIMGGLQALAIIAPTAYGHIFPTLLLISAVAYFALSPWFYWRFTDDTTDTTDTPTPE